jgi:cyanophycinase
LRRWLRTNLKATSKSIGHPLPSLVIEERDEATIEDKLADLRDVSAVFFSGGDQLRITSLIGDTPIDEHIHEIFANGGVIAATSAGASAMCETMLVRGSNAVPSGSETSGWLRA